MFKLGDRVKYVSNHYKDGEWNPLWGGKYGKVVGTVISVVGSRCRIKWDNGGTNGGYDPSDLDFVKVEHFDDGLFLI